MAPQSRPLAGRPLDILYLVFFVIHLPVMFVVDLTPLYPAAVHSLFPFLGQIRSWYITTYNDRFFVDPPAWFILYAAMEALYHVPLTLWAIRALWNDDPMVPVQLLIFACQTGFTTATCIADFMSWQDFSSVEKLGLSQLYGPYLLLSIVIGADMFRRLKKQILRQHSAEAAVAVAKKGR